MIPRPNKILYPELSYEICGLCFEAHNKLGRYLNEKQCADYLEQLFKDNNIQYVREKPLPAAFEGEKPRRNIPDFVIEDNIILDLKAKYIVTKDDYFQMQRYLNSYNKKLGLIVNFRRKYLAPKRIINANFKELEEVSPEPETFLSKLRSLIKH